MKGLFYRELYLTRKTYLSAVCVYVLITVLCVLINLSISFGNLRYLIAADNKATLDSLFYISVIIPSAVLYLMSSANFELIDKDITSKWLLFQYSTPVSEKKYAFVKIMIIFCTISFSFIMSMANAALFCALYGRSLERELLGLLLVLMPVTALGALLLISLTIFLKSSTTAAILIIIAAFAAAYPFMMKLIIASSDNSEDFTLMPFLENIARFIPAYPVITLFILAAGQLVITAILKKRENFPRRIKKEAVKK